MDYNYILFEQSAVEFLASRREYQNTEHDEGIAFVDLIRRPRRNVSHLGSRLRIKWTEDGVVFIGPKPTKTILTVDLTTCELLKFEGDSPSDLLVVLQRMFRAAIRIWNHQPFTNVERVNHSKLVVFPFSYNLNGRDNKRLVTTSSPPEARRRRTPPSSTARGRSTFAFSPLSPAPGRMFTAPPRCRSSSWRITTQPLRWTARASATKPSRSSMTV